MLKQILEDMDKVLLEMGGDLETEEPYTSIVSLPQAKLKPQPQSKDEKERSKEW